MTYAERIRLARLRAKEIVVLDRTNPDENPELRTALLWRRPVRNPSRSGWRSR